jgi:hypothetical protein
MIRVKVQYDADQRTFKLVDQDFKTLLEGDALYDLQIPYVFEAEMPEELISSNAPAIAHA